MIPCNYGDTSEVNKTTSMSSRRAPTVQSPSVSITGKRKRGQEQSSPPSKTSADPSPVTLQIVTGSYERVLHGISATLPASGSSPVVFQNNFLFNAHSSSVRCLAVSPATDGHPNHSSKRILATGSTDERINLYQISSGIPEQNSSKGQKTTPSLALLPFETTGSFGNHELGSLLHHTSAVTALHFPSRGKLLSTSLDNNIAVTRVRDWTVLSTIHAPIPKPAGRPSGDTAASGEIPAGINAVAVHPSAKLCLTVGRGERCMRLWNLVTGKKAGVLTFEKKLLNLLGEGRWRGGEGQQVVWSNDGEEFAVGFAKGVLIYGLDCTVRGLVKLPSSKICQIRYLPDHASHPGLSQRNIIVVSTEDGQILFYDTGLLSTSSPTLPTDDQTPSGSSVKAFTMVGKLIAGTDSYRIKDFEILNLPTQTSLDAQVNGDVRTTESKLEHGVTYAIISATSNGTISVALFNSAELASASSSLDAILESEAPHDSAHHSAVKHSRNSDSREIGKTLGTFETGRRITCIATFIMQSNSI